MECKKLFKELITELMTACRLNRNVKKNLEKKRKGLSQAHRAQAHQKRLTRYLKPKERIKEKKIAKTRKRTRTKF